MISAAKILSSYLSGLDHLGSVEGASILVPSSEGLGLSQIFVREGELAVPEMEDELSSASLESRYQSQEGALPIHPSVEVFPSRESCCRLFRIVVDPSRKSTLGKGGTAEWRRQSDSTELYLRAGCVVWLGIRFSESSLVPFPNQRLLLKATATSEVSARDLVWWGWAIEFGGKLAQHLREVASILNDPVTGVPGRAQLQSQVSRAFAKARMSAMPLTIMLISPDDFALVNQRFGHQDGDRVLKVIATRVQAALRGTDFLARYGGAIFGILLPATSADDARGVAEKLLDSLNREPFLEGAIKLQFRAGMATYLAGTDALTQALDLTCRAEVALFNSRRPAGRSLVLWETDLEADEHQGDDSIGGFFTGNMAKDYRNMQLLADIVRVVAASPGFHELAEEAAAKLSAVLKPDHVSLYEYSEQSGLSLIRGRDRDSASAVDKPADSRLALLDEALRKSRPLTQHIDDARTGQGFVCCAIPLMVGGEALGGLYMEGRPEDFLIDGADLLFLRSLASQLAVALDRAKLSLQEKRREEQERQKLKAEVEELRQAVQSSNLEYRSEQMEAVMGTVRRVAVTDATVLVTGESGTGKDMISRSLHQLSRRRKKPLVVVDCASIPATLIESELFGHAKGAFSGAGQKRVGRLEQGDGATVFLDEIGELPLEVQSKLLRFVQEKQLTPVGSSVTREVDVRLIAATNRDLLTEVRAGRFREDLYYRLNVVRIAIPSLRERPADILHLAYHYLRTYALLYHKDVVSFTHEAEALLAGYDWPGNVRELQNRIQQAVILADGGELSPEALALDEPRFHQSAAYGTAPESATGGGGHSAVDFGEPGPNAVGSYRAEGSGDRQQGATLVAPLDPVSIARFSRPSESLRSPEGTLKSPEGEPLSWQDCLQSLGVLIARYSVAVVAGERPPIPIGRFIGEDLVLQAHEYSDHVACHAAGLLGLAETTFRRRRSKAQSKVASGLVSRPEWWAQVRSLIRSLLEASDLPEVGLDHQLEELVLAEVSQVVGEDHRVGSELVGVTRATYRRRLEALTVESLDRV